MLNAVKKAEELLNYIEKLKTNNMKQEFIPYEQALELKELGFDEECFAFYDYYTKGAPLKIYDSQSDCCGEAAPLYQQAFRWFREKKLSDSCVVKYQEKDDGGIYFFYCIDDNYGVEETRYFKGGFHTYKAAELACLKRLIKIIKNK
jgi:hypothetical protein